MDSGVCGFLGCLCCLVALSWVCGQFALCLLAGLCPDGR